MRVCQCWDDGVVDDIRLIGILRRHRAKASFNLNIGLHEDQRGKPWRYKQIKDVHRLALPELREVYQGFTIANHTVSHPWPTKLDDATLEREIVDGRKRLQDHFQQEVLGFAYPFGDHDARVMAAVRAAGHVYARTCKNAERILPCPDPMALPSHCHVNNADFWKHFERVKAEDGVFYFWGHAYEFVTEDDWAAFDAKIARLSADPAVRWTELPELFNPAQAA